MPPRYKARCRYCPQLAATPASTPTPAAHGVLAITSPGEGDRLWKHVLFGTATCVQMIEGYAALKMPGSPQDALVALRDRIQTVLSKYEEAHATSESVRPAEPDAPADPPASEALPG